MIEKRVAAPAPRGTAGTESLKRLDSVPSLPVGAVVSHYLRVTPRVSRARIMNTLSGDFERVGVEERERQASLLALHRWEHARRDGLGEAA